MSLDGLHRFRGADNVTVARLLREAQRGTLLLAAVKGLFFGVLLGVFISLLSTRH